MGLKRDTLSRYSYRIADDADDTQRQQCCDRWDLKPKTISKCDSTGTKVHTSSRLSVRLLVSNEVVRSFVHCADSLALVIALGIIHYLVN